MREYSDEDLMRIAGVDPAKAGKPITNNDYSDEDLMKIAGVDPTKVGKPASQSSFLGNVNNALQQRGANLANIVDATARGQQTGAEGLFQGAGQELGAGGDVIGQGIASLAKTGYGALPDSAQQKISGLASDVANSQLGKLVGKGVNAYNQNLDTYNQQNPRMGRDFEAVRNMAALIPVGGTSAAGAVADVGGDLLKAGAKGIDAGVTKLLPEGINPATASLAQKALDYNIPLSRTQIGESPTAKTFASASAKIPLSGAQAFAKEQNAAFTREALSTIGADSDKVTPEVLAQSYQNISNKFNNALNGQEVKISDDMLTRLNSIDKQAREELTDDNYGIVKKQIDKLFNNISPDDTIAGEKLGNLRSDLSAMSRSGGGERRFVGQLKNFVQDVSVDGAPERKAELQDAINKFRNYQVLKPLLNKAVKGDIPPGLLLGRVASNFQDFAQGGGGKLGDLARIGKVFLQDPIPDSGTAQRLMAYKALGGTGAILAGTAATNLPAALAAAAVPVAAARGFNAINTSQRLVGRAIRGARK